MNFFRFAKLIRLRNRGNLFYWGICSLIFIAGIIFEGQVQVTNSFSSFISHIEISFVDFFTILSGLSSTIAVLIAIYTYLNWSDIKQKYHTYELAQKLKEYANYFAIVDRLKNKEPIAMKREEFETLVTTFASYLPEEQLEALIKTYEDFEALLDKKVDMKYVLKFEDQIDSLVNKI